MVVPAVIVYDNEEASLSNSIYFLVGMGLWFTHLGHHVNMYASIYVASNPVMAQIMFGYVWGLIPLIIFIAMVLNISRSKAWSNFFG